MGKIDQRFEIVETIRSNIRKFDLRNLANMYGIKNLNDKGWVGKTLEKFVGLSNSTISGPDGPDFELKSVKVIDKSGDWHPDQTMAITMFHPGKILNELSFESSTLWSKLHRLIIVGYDSDNVIRFVRPIDVSDQQLKCHIRHEWNYIHHQVSSGNIATYSSKGTSNDFIQLRTKGSGKSQSTCPKTGEKFNTRAFYATKRFLRYVWGVCDI